MSKPESLLVFPWTKVRVSCPCGYRKAYRLARLAEHYGADFKLDALLWNLMCDRCPKLSGRRPSFAGTVLDFGRIGAGDPATVLADRRSRLSCARSSAR